MGIGERTAVKPLIALLFATSLCIGAGCSKQDREQKKDHAAVPVTVAKAFTHDIPVSVSAVGRAEAFESVTLKSRIDGQIAKVLYTEGQFVKKGEVLIQLDPADYTARLHQAEANVVRDNALQAKAKTDLTRYAELRSKNFISEEKLNEIRTNQDTSAANAKASQAALELAQVQQAFTTIRAPFSGQIGARLVFPGSAVKASDTSLAIVNRVTPLLVTFALPESQLGMLKEAMTKGDVIALVQVPGTEPSQAPIKGKIRFIDNAVDSATGTILVKAEIPNEEHTLTPGQFLNVSLVLKTLKDATVLPTAAVQQGPDSALVFVVTPDNTVQLKKVKVLAESHGLSAVSEGITPGDTVVTDGQLKLKPKTKVSIKTPEAQQKSARHKE